MAIVIERNKNHIKNTESEVDNMRESTLQDIIDAYNEWKESQN